MSRVSTPAQLKTFFENLIDDTIDTDFFYNLLNKANDELIQERDWELFKSPNTTYSTAVGDTYLTTHALPTDFFTPRRYIYVGNLRYAPIPFEKRILYKDSARKYYIDHANAVFAICGTQGSVQTITFLYNKIPTEITSADSASSTIIKWPSLFRTILAFKMADIIEAGVDADDIAFRMSEKQRAEYARLKKGLESWDARLKLHAMDFSSADSDDAGEDYDEGDPNLGSY